MSDMTHRSGDSSPGDPGGDRGATELLLGALAGSTLLPFLQAIASRAGEDAYKAVRDKLSRKARKRAAAELRAAGAITVADWDARIVLQAPKTITTVMAARLTDVRLPVARTGWLLLRWDAALNQWLVESCDEPPAT